MTFRAGVADGWLRYWLTFRQPWSVVFGFALATIAADLLWECVFYLYGKCMR